MFSVCSSAISFNLPDPRKIARQSSGQIDIQFIHRLKTIKLNAATILSALAAMAEHLQGKQRIDVEPIIEAKF